MVISQPRILNIWKVERESLYSSKQHGISCLRYCNKWQTYGNGSLRAWGGPCRGSQEATTTVFSEVWEVVAINGATLRIGDSLQNYKREELIRPEKVRNKDLAWRLNLCFESISDALTIFDKISIEFAPKIWNFQAWTWLPIGGAAWHWYLTWAKLQTTTK